MEKMIAIASDHAGFKYKEQIREWLSSQSYQVTDFGTFSPDSVDYPDFVHPLARAIEEGSCDQGILICGSANGVAMTANKHQGIRAAICWNTELAALARQHNNANVICLAERFFPFELTKEIVTTFLNTEFEGGRHQRRVDKMSIQS